jgi:hypothetical protein
VNSRKRSSQEVDVLKKKPQGGGGKGEEMTQILYAHMNKIKIKK